MTATIDWRPARLRATRDLTPDIRLFEIEPESPFEPPSPGSHIKVTVDIDGRPDTRSYSVIDACRDAVYRIAVKRLADSHGGSRHMWRLQPGAALSVGMAVNDFPLTAGRPEYLLIAGGIGITPIHAHALALAERGADFRLLYGVRRASDLAFADALGRRLGPRLETFVGEAGQRIDLAAEIARLALGGELYVCGPLPMLDAARQAWRDSGRPDDLLRFETFGRSGRFPTVPFTVRVAGDGRAIEVPPGRSMLEALEAAGVEMISDCRRGECGLCALPILAADGPVDHRDVFFSDEEKAANAKLCTCVSRFAGGSVTVDTGERPV